MIIGTKVVRQTQLRHPVCMCSNIILSVFLDFNYNEWSS